MGETYSVVYFDKSHICFVGIICSSSGLKCEPSRTAAKGRQESEPPPSYFISLGLLLDPEDEGDMLLRNVGLFS
jgi:hypothetical protein